MKKVKFRIKRMTGSIVSKDKPKSRVKQCYFLWHRVIDDAHFSLEEVKIS